MEIPEAVKTSFARSPIWSLQRQFFLEQGIQAWSGGKVPHYITNNPFLARTYAEIVFGFFRDRERAGRVSAEPVYLLELGGGTGRLAFHVLRHLAFLCADAAFPVPSYCYILSDVPRQNISFWQSHPRLHPYMEEGKLDFACFDATATESPEEGRDGADIRLLHSGRRLLPGSLAQPLIVIANYFFDSIPQELFRFKRGKAYECSVSLRLPAESERLTVAERLARFELKYHYKETRSFGCEEEGLQALLEQYRNELEDAHVLLPVAGLRCMDRLRGLSGEGFVLLSADKGDCRLQELEGRGPPAFARHGSFSLPVNFHAFQSYYERQGGCFRVAAHRYNHVRVAATLMLPDAEVYRETSLAYKRFVESFGPDEFYSLKQFAVKHAKFMALEPMLSMLRLSGYDARLYEQCLPQLWDIAPDFTAAEKDDFLEALSHVWDGYYPIGGPKDLMFETGTLLYRMDCYEDAVVYFLRSLEMEGECAAAFYNMGACFYRIRQDEEALVCFERCLKFDPEHAEALALIGRLDVRERSGS